jgi:flavodoxin
MKIKKLIGMIAIFTMALGVMTGCRTESAKNDETSNNVQNTESSEILDHTATETVQETADNSDGKILVVYYSATGSTKAVAQTIADTVGADLFEITPVEPYTDEDLNWTDDSSRVSKEHDDESLRDVEITKATPENWDSYDTVMIGYPIWWGIAAWPVNNFIKENDFTGKTVIPFCTSASSGLGDSGNLLEEMAKTGEWQEGERFRSGVSDSDVQEWVNSLDFNH